VDENMGDNRRLIIVSFIALILVSIFSYQFAASKHASKISELENTLTQRELEFTKLTSEAKAPSQVSGGGQINCLFCHDLSKTKSFHLAQTIMKIGEKRGKRRRICIDCHGPKAYDEQDNYIGWSPDDQMTPSTLISFDDEAGDNGVFIIPYTVPHIIHQRYLRQLKVMTCEDCHLYGKEIKRPKADVDKGHVLVCQNCKYHPEDGNFIKIHVEDGGNGCPTCHTGGAIEVHKDKTFQLGTVG
jgi:nitrate/TMAO reductase-like tetraheme cytochrome c subunit